MSTAENDVEFEDTDKEAQAEPTDLGFGEAFLTGTDWTAETIATQLDQQNINLNPRFQRRDAWSLAQKSRLIESLIVGLPVPEIILAAQPGARGKYLVLDGKQRLLSILQFWGLGTGPNNSYSLRGLELIKLPSRTRRPTFANLAEVPELIDYYNSLRNSTIRTVVIHNWPNEEFLHTIFLRLNTGSKKLSPQELRHALHPGPFTNWVDDRSTESKPLAKLLRLHQKSPDEFVPDYRMRDVELLARAIAFFTRMPTYSGRLKAFLDATFEHLNSQLASEGVPSEPTGREDSATLADLHHALDRFEVAVQVLIEIFNVDRVARKPESRSFNKAVFDALAFVAMQDGVAEAMLAYQENVRRSYDDLFKNQNFRQAVELDTAGLNSTVYRIASWGQKVSAVTSLPVRVPRKKEVDGRSVIELVTEAPGVDLDREP